MRLGPLSERAVEISDWKLFHEALEEHRTEVLDRSLPVFKIDVDGVLKA